MGRLKLFDGVLRRDVDPDMRVDVEVFDVTKEESGKLPLTINPLAAFAHTQQKIHDRLRDTTSPSLNCQTFWELESQNLLSPTPSADFEETAEQYLILLTCRDKKEQMELLRGFLAKRLK